MFLIVRERGVYTFWHSKVTRLSSENGLELIEAESPVIIDARGLQEYQVSHLAGAARYEPGLFDTISKDKPLLIYCTIGVRSNALAETLTSQGFNNVYELKRGILGWGNSNYPVINNKGQLTEEIHVYSKFFSSFLKGRKAIY